MLYFLLIILSSITDDPIEYRCKAWGETAFGRIEGLEGKEGLLGMCMQKGFQYHTIRVVIPL